MPSIHGMQGGAPKYKLVYNPINYHQQIIYHKPWLHCLDTTFAHHLVAVAKSFPKWSSGYPSGTILLTVWKRQRWPLVRAGSRKKGRLCRRRRRLGMAWREGGSSGVLAIYWDLSSHWLAISGSNVYGLQPEMHGITGLPWITMDYHIHYMVFVCCITFTTTTYGWQLILSRRGYKSGMLWDGRIWPWPAMKKVSCFVDGKSNCSHKLTCFADLQ
jgi:hypothetical protein